MTAMRPRRSRVRAVAVSLPVVVLLSATGASGQTRLSVVSTIEPRESAASRVARVLKDLVTKQKDEGWSYDDRPCSELTGVLAAAGPAAILTTPDCLEDSVSIRSAAVSANVGEPAYFFTLVSESLGVRTIGNIFQADATIGVLQTVSDHYRIQQAVRDLWRTDVQIEAVSDYPQLVDGLRSHRFAGVCVIEDGTGTSIDRLYQAANNPDDVVSILPVSLPRPVGLSATGINALLVQPQFVDSPWRDRSQAATGGDTAIVFSTADAPAGPQPDDKPSSFVARIMTKLLGEPARAAERPPLPVVSPILVTKGEVAPEVVDAVRHAMLAAPLDALINPCRDRDNHERLYRSFLRGAIGSATRDPLLTAVMWEHAALLQSRSPSEASFARQRRHLEESLGESQRVQLVEAFLAAHKGGECHVPRRGIFRNGKLAYYQYSIERLREVLAASPSTPASATNPASALLNEAAACLREAFGQSALPTCGEPLSGMWTAYYAPYLPMAVIETERRHARR